MTAAITRGAAAMVSSTARPRAVMRSRGRDGAGANGAGENGAGETVSALISGLLVVPPVPVDRLRIRTRPGAGCEPVFRTYLRSNKRSSVSPDVSGIRSATLSNRCLSRGRQTDTVSITEASDQMPPTSVRVIGAHDE